MGSDLTPMMRQYLDIKRENKDAILFFRLGDFYEMFFDDAKEATRILHITLTAREAGKGNKVPMCGIPFHAADNYIARLVKHGKKVAICEQMEEPSPGKKLVRREITRIITPGTFIADEILDSTINNYILSLAPRDGIFGLAYADLSTGEFRVAEISEKEDLLAELYKISPSECLLPEGYSKDPSFRQISDLTLGALTIRDDWMFDPGFGMKEMSTHFGVRTLEGYGCDQMPLAVGAAGALLRYLKDTQKNDLVNFDKVSVYSIGEFMVMDRNSHRNLEIIHNMEDMGTRGTLVEVMDEALTPMGKRRLKVWLLNPLVEVTRITERHDAVQFFHDERDSRRKVRALLAETYDIERLSNKVMLGTAGPRDLASLSFSLAKLHDLKTTAISGDIPGLLKAALTDISDFSALTARINFCMVDLPPVSSKDGGIIRDGYDQRVDELRSLIGGSKDWLASLQKSEIERTGISSLKVGYNQVFGYYIEVSNAKIDAVPQNYIRKQTLVNAERFITQELKEHEAKILGAEEKIKELEMEIFTDLRLEVATRIGELKKASEAAADIDVLASLAEVAEKNKYVRPRMTRESGILITGGRHPVLEKVLKGRDFVPNDIRMDDEENRIFIITGSNMAGKSTFIRQIAIIVVMAQIGSFVPADGATIGVVDRVFTRVGASDRLYRGMSTFMVEMLETAYILNNATGKSLIILDEIGRGTSTFDGVSIAWAVVEFIHHSLKGAKALFATHFHELTELNRVMRGIKNYHLAIQQWREEVVFLYKVKEGSCDESFGIHVARLAGMPPGVVKRAREILGNLRKDSFRGSLEKRFAETQASLPERQLSLFGAEDDKAGKAAERLRSINVDDLTPVEALNLIADIRKELGENGK
ncbi:MAG: DNA mismatch repair protein MutS [Candidatus Omnitrophica bacterium]|nr:DNA mismatch repair protein MutS [Candidatus Omnitrophota bacterium]